jgi:hypothetical protein
VWGVPQATVYSHLKGPLAPPVFKQLLISSSKATALHQVPTAPPPLPQSHTAIHFCQSLSHLLLERHGLEGTFECPWVALVPS